MSFKKQLDRKVNQWFNKSFFNKNNLIKKKHEDIFGSKEDLDAINNIRKQKIREKELEDIFGSKEDLDAINNIRKQKIREREHEDIFGSKEDLYAISNIRAQKIREKELEELRKKKPTRIIFENQVKTKYNEIYNNKFNFKANNPKEFVCNRTTNKKEISKMIKRLFLDIHPDKNKIPKEEANILTRIATSMKNQCDLKCFYR